MSESNPPTTDLEGHQRPYKYVVLLVISMSVVALLDNTLSLLESSVISLMSVDFGFLPGSGEIQVWIGVFGIVSFGVIFINWFTDAFGRKKGLFLLCLVMGVPAVLLPVLTPAGPAGLIPSMVLYSIMTLATQANTWEIPVAEEVHAKKRGLLGAVPFLVGLVPLYAIVGERIAEALGSWKWSYAILGGIMLVASLVMLSFMKETTRWLAAKEEIKKERAGIVKTLKLLGKKDWLYITTGAITYFVWGTCFKLGTLAGQDMFTGLGQAAQFKTYLTIGGLMTIPGALVSGIMMDKVGRRATLITGCTGAIASFLLLGFTFSPVFYISVYFFMPMVLAYITVYFLSEIFPTRVRATCAGAVITLSRASYIAGPVISGALMMAFNVAADTAGWTGYWVVGGLLMLVPLVVQFIVKHYETMHKTLETIETDR